MYQSGRAGDEAKKRKSPAKSGRVGITVTSFNKNNRANFCGEKKKNKKNNKAFWGDDIF